MTTTYQNLFHAASTKVSKEPINLIDFATPNQLAEQSLSKRLTASLQILLERLSDDEQDIERINSQTLDQAIIKLDLLINKQLDAVLHHKEFQKLESIWRSIKYLVDQNFGCDNTKIELLNISKNELTEDFSDNSDLTQSLLYKKVYVEEYDTPGGEPVAAMISNYTFRNNSDDLKLLKNLAHISAATHCPFLGSINSDFFGKQNMHEVMQISDLKNYMEKSEYIAWNDFRTTEDVRYLGLTLPKFLLRLPYDCNNTFKYKKNVNNSNSNYLWGSTAFTLAANMLRSFQKYGWALNITGPESGGKVHDLPLHYYDIGYGLEAKIPTEAMIPETRELEFANLGFIPLSYYKNSNFACYFSANSLQKPEIYDNNEATCNSRINAKLPYIFLTSRLAHYLKVLQRENIGSSKNHLELERELNRWLKTLITKMNNPEPELIATHPLQDGHVQVIETPDNPGFYEVALYVVPHFKVEGISVKLALTGKLPRFNNN
ncbi:MAG: type VI secretion system contractile sheath large subunit [Gammaproteobacteria bacterium]|nr:type VI secretion system contractile sheath large subunit [Gammaproteobacteria bacterium]